MYDVIIIGAGPAGISASLYTKRANLKTMIIYNREDSSLEKTAEIENYYGFEDGIGGEELYQKGIRQAQNLGIEMLQEEVTNIQVKENYFKVETLKQTFLSRTVILATGNKKNKPQIDGINEFEGRGISYCAICDVFFYRNKDVAVIGSGDYAISETRDLSSIAKSITILTNGDKEAKIPEYRDENIQVNEKKIKEIDGKNKVEKIKFEDDTEIKVDGIFIAQGVAGSTEFARKLGAKIDDNNIAVNENMETTIKGLYACGDCTGGVYQIAKAVYEGMKAGLQVIKYTNSKK